MKKLTMIAAVLSALAASAEIAITGVTARQRWPWNGLVDIDFTISGAAAGEAFAIDIDATAASGATALSAKTYATEPVAGAGLNRIVWDFGADYPEFRANDVRISVTATPLSGAKSVYLVVDLSGGPAAEKYPVRYTTSAPAHIRGAANEPCQTTELWMRRIIAPDAAFTVNSYAVAENPTTDAQKRNFWGKMTKDYYIGVFELTQKQYQLVMGEWHNSWFTNGQYRASRPVEGLKFYSLTGTWDDTQASPSSISAASFLGKVRAKTGLPVNIPSNIQLNFAARGGTLLDGGVFNSYYVNGVSPDRTDVARCKNNVEITSPERNCDAKSGTANVGTYIPNEYGLYDTLGNVSEFTSEIGYSNTGIPCREYYWELYKDDTVGNTSVNPVIDPPGLPRGHALMSAYVTSRIARHGAWHLGASDFTLWTMSCADSSYAEGSTYLKSLGFRLSMTVE
jgi:formylglycine-generating enzyme required for sulfatase activity